jgi:hypothetical protein
MIYLVESLVIDNINIIKIMTMTMKRSMFYAMRIRCRCCVAVDVGVVHNNTYRYRPLLCRTSRIHSLVKEMMVGL